MVPKFNFCWRGEGSARNRTGGARCFSLEPLAVKTVMDWGPEGNEKRVRVEERYSGTGTRKYIGTLFKLADFLRVEK